MACAALLASCDGLSGGGKSRLQAENDSLQAALNQRDAELDEMMGTFNEISEGFRQINAAENRVDLQRGSLSEGSLSAKQQIAADIEFIQKQMQENKEQIAKLQEMLKSSRNNSAQLKRAVESLTQELVEKVRPHSLSGGVLADSLFYCTGHDAAECYVLRLPRLGSSLEWVDTLPLPFHGQAFGIDPEGNFWGIERKTQEVIRATRP